MRLRAFLSYATVSALIVAVPAPAWAGGGGGRLVFESETVAGDHTQTDIVSIGVDGSRLRRLTNTKDLNELGPSWNGAGTRIAFWRTPAPFGPGSVWTMDADGRHQRRLTGSRTDARDPVFDRAGKRIAYPNVTADGFHLWVMRADGSGKRQVTKGAALDFEAAWSPDGKRVAFGSDRGGGFDDLWVVSATGQGLHRVRALTGSEAFPDWKR